MQWRWKCCHAARPCNIHTRSAGYGMKPPSHMFQRDVMLRHSQATREKIWEPLKAPTRTVNASPSTQATLHEPQTATTGPLYMHLTRTQGAHQNSPSDIKAPATGTAARHPTLQIVVVAGPVQPPRATCYVVFNVRRWAAHMAHHGVAYPGTW